MSPRRSFLFLVFAEESNVWSQQTMGSQRGAVVGAKVQGHLVGNHPHEGSVKRPSSSLHGRPGATN